MTADAVVLKAREAARSEPESHPAGRSLPGKPPANVASLHEEQLSHVPPDTRPLPPVTLNDQVLRCRPASEA